MTVDEIIEYMLASVPEEYDTSVGSFFYDLLYPVTEQVYRLQDNILDLEVNVFALTAVGEYLDRKVAEQGITRKQATFAKGTVRISGDVGAVVQQGAKVASGDILFAVDEETEITDIGYVDVPATCITAGVIGNVGIGQINRFPVTLPKLTEVTNLTAFTGGYTEETDEELRKRYFEKVSRPNVSGNKYHYIEWAKEVSGVGSVQVIPLWNGPGTVKLIITNINNQLADDDLVAEVKEHIDTCRPVGADVTVESAAALEINISVTVIGGVKDSIKSEMENSIYEYLSEVALNKTYVSYARIGSLILAISGVEDYSELKVNESTSNIQLDDGVIPVLGSVVIA